MSRIIFITGTDTGVGKTVVASMLAHFARTAGVDTIALKPLCSGTRTDAEVLSAVCGTTPEAINPWHFPEPVSPWTAARKQNRRVTKDEVVGFIRQQSKALVIVEGAGGVMAPLGERFDSADLIRELGAEVILVAQNRLGVMNHALLSAAAVKPAPTRIALVDGADDQDDASASSNLEDLRELAAPIEVIPFPRLAGFRRSKDSIEKHASRVTEAVRALLQPC